MEKLIHKGNKIKNLYELLLVGNVGYAPTTPRMSIEYSTIELIPLFKNIGL